MPFHDGLPEILPPSEDGVFQSTFTRETAKPALIELLSDILGRQLKDVQVRKSDPPINSKDAKREVFDINCVAEDDSAQFDVEMQATPMDHDKRENEHINIRNRSVFNLCDLHASQPGRGARYDKLMRSYQITICNYNVFNWKNQLTETFTYRNESGHQLSDITTAIFIDLTKALAIAKKPVAEMSEVEQWVLFLAKANNRKYRKLITEILKRKGGISVAYETLTSISTDENERARYLSRRIWERDRAHEKAVREDEIAESLAKGFAKGHAKGRAEGYADAFNTLKDLGVPPEIIAQANARLQEQAKLGGK